MCIRLIYNCRGCCHATGREVTEGCQLNDMGECYNEGVRYIFLYQKDMVSYHCPHNTVPFNSEYQERDRQIIAELHESVTSSTRRPSQTRRLPRRRTLPTRRALPARREGDNKTTGETTDDMDEDDTEEEDNDDSDDGDYDNSKGSSHQASTSSGTRKTRVTIIARTPVPATLASGSTPAASGASKVIVASACKATASTAGASSDKKVRPPLERNAWYEDEIAKMSKCALGWIHACPGGRRKSRLPSPPSPPSPLLPCEPCLTSGFSSQALPRPLAAVGSSLSGVDSTATEANT